MKLKELLTRQTWPNNWPRKWRDAQGRLTDEAYDAYKATCNAYPGGFVPDDELGNVDVIWPESWDDVPICPLCKQKCDSQCLG